jgi:hypothetical protein
LGGVGPNDASVGASGVSNALADFSRHIIHHQRIEKNSTLKIHWEIPVAPTYVYGKQLGVPSGEFDVGDGVR